MSGRVCLISPGHLATNPRLVKEARTLCDHGFDIDVITGSYLPWAVEQDRRIASAGWRVRPAPFGRRVAPRSAYIRQAIEQRLARSAYGLGWKRPRTAAAAVAGVARDLAREASKVRADLYIAHYVAALPAAAAAARRHGGRYAFDAEDFHLGDLPDEPQHALDKELIRAIEGCYLPGAAYVTAASPGIAEALEAAYGIPRPTVVLNVFPRSEAPVGATPRGWAEPGPSVYWFSQTIGPNRGLECAVRGLALAVTKPHLYLRGTPAAGFRDRLNGLASEVGAGDRLHWLPPAAPSEMTSLAAGYDVGLVAETGETENRRIALTNKQFTYLLAGVPAVMSDVPAHRRFAEEAKGAAFLYRTEDAQDLAATLDALLRGPSRLAEGRARAYHLGAERFNWEKERSDLLTLAFNAIHCRDGVSTQSKGELAGDR